MSDLVPIHSRRLKPNAKFHYPENTKCEKKIIINSCYLAIAVAVEEEYLRRVSADFYVVNLIVSA